MLAGRITVRSAENDRSVLKCITSVVTVVFDLCEMDTLPGGMYNQY